MNELNIADRSIDVLRKETVYRGFFSVDEVEVRYQRPDGTMSPPTSRTCVERGDAVGILVFLEEAEQILLVRQFRYPILRHGEPWLVEVVAGAIDQGETAEVAARRELREETSLECGALLAVGKFYASPGGVSELVSIFFTSVPKAPQELLGGLPDEDLELLVFSATELYAMLQAGKVRDGKTQVALYWFYASEHGRRFTEA
jgi:nudix-type nucleoside diphosphatase (YffH/AdpP family)